jgi:hypothetical protein
MGRILSKAAMACFFSGRISSHAKFVEQKASYAL